MSDIKKTIAEMMSQRKLENEYQELSKVQFIQISFEKYNANPQLWQEISNDQCIAIHLS